MSSQQKLQQPIINGSLRATNFFNGRLVTGADMTREQTARREAVWRVGKAAGDGIVYGLEVEKDAAALSTPIVSVSKGLAVNRCGQILCLSQDTTVDLLQRFGAIEQPSKIFGDCKPLAMGTYAAGFGLYLLVLSPAETSEGSAPTGGLHNAPAACNTDMILETVQFRLLPIDPFLSNDVFPSNKLLRNYIAYKCFGAERAQAFFQNPLGSLPSSYGLMDEMREKSLSDSDVPLAIVHWTSGGLQFVEMWAVRRRLTKRNAVLARKNRDSGLSGLLGDHLSELIGDRSLSETEAMLHQFADQIRGSQPEKNDFREIRAGDYFRYLPPVGMLPLASQNLIAGFDLERFFGSRRLKDIAMLEGEGLRSLFLEALSHEPINLSSDEKIQLYFIRENFQAVQAKQVNQYTLVFAKRSIPYCGIARFDAALTKWELSRFV